MSLRSPAIKGIVQVLIILTLLFSQGENGRIMADTTKHKFIPDKGFIPDAVTAIRVAEAILAPIYGEEVINREKPFSASLQNGVWVIRGRLPEGLKGGVAEIEIAQNNACVLRVSHGK